MESTSCRKLERRKKVIVARRNEIEIAHFNVEHPFLYFIMDHSDGTILFQGSFCGERFGIQRRRHEYLAKRRSELFATASQEKAARQIITGSQLPFPRTPPSDNAR